MRMLTLVTGLVLAVGTVASSQDDRRGGDRGLEWYLNRMKERLNLSDEQFSKIKELAQQGRDTEEKLQKEREEKVKELLTEEQRKQYDEFRRNPMGGGGGRSGGGGGGNGGAGWLERFLAPAVDQLKKDLGLTDEQADKVKTYIDEFNEKARARFDEMSKNGFQGIDWQEETKKFQDSVKDLADKIKTHLNDEQKEKLDKLVEERWNLNRWGGGGGGAQRRDNGPRRPSVEERVRRAMESLKIESAEEAAAVRDLVKKAVEAQYALEDYERDVRGKLEELSKKADAGEDEIKGKIEEWRTGRKEKDKALKDAQKALAELVTYKQELELIKHGLLR